MSLTPSERLDAITAQMYAAMAEGVDWDDAMVAASREISADDEVTAEASRRLEAHRNRSRSELVLGLFPSGR